MTATQTPHRPQTDHGSSQASEQSGRRRVRRTAVILALVLSLLLTGLTRWLSDRQRLAVLTKNGQIPLPTSRGANLSGMNSFALALLLGGLRGPLVMILWQQSETQKQEKNLEGVDTQIEWIRMLQPEFDSVHIFQIWNKAYNISVQMASLTNKYITIVDALEYAFRVDDERPHNINILTSIAQTFSDKLGNSQEKDFYRARVRDDSKWRELPQGQESRTIRHTRLDPRLDAQGNILKQYLRPTLLRPHDLAADKPWPSGADLEFLKQYEPYPYGVSPFAFAFNYHKRAQVLQDAMGLRHAQLSDLVIDSRPALTLKAWADEEWDRGRRLEAAMMKTQPLTEQQQEADPTRRYNGIILDNRQQNELLTANLTPGEILRHPGLEEMLFSYGRSARLARDGVAEYERHLNNQEFSPNLSTYQSHIDHLRATEALMLADRAYLQALAASNADERRNHLSQAVTHYRDAVAINQRTMLQYFVDPAVLQRLGADRSKLTSMPADQLNGLTTQVIRYLNQHLQEDVNREDRLEYQRYMERAQIRLKLIGS